MGIAMMIQLALQAAVAAVKLLQEAGYLKPDDGERMMQTLMNGHLPPEAQESRPATVPAPEAR